MGRWVDDGCMNGRMKKKQSRRWVRDGMDTGWLNESKGTR